jgi:4-aminobutyrate aminotransferase-like enzyme
MPQYLGRTTTLENYDADGEPARTMFADVIVAGRRINRGTAHVRLAAAPDSAEARAARKRLDEAVLPTTLDADAPVVVLDWPMHGPWVLAPHGVYFDAYHGVAQRILDPHLPPFKRMVEGLVATDLVLRREIATDDVLAFETEHANVKGPIELARAWDRAARDRWPHAEGYRVFLSSSGAEAIEAALKLCYQVAYKRFLERHGMDAFRRVQDELGAAPVPFFEGDPGLRDHPVFADYPFQVVACEGAFHGRTMGALSLTWSKRAQHLGYPKPWNVHHVPFNDPGDPLRDRIDMRPIGEILAEPGELRRVVREQRRIPRDLFAGFFAEPFQGEGGYVPGDPAYFARVRAVCDEADGLLVVDEVQSVGRTGRLFMTEHLGVRPDVVCTAKSMVVGVTIARADLARHCHGGWHSNTWGGGRVFDTSYAWTTLDTLLHHRDPVFDGLTYLENTEVKGRMLAEGLETLVERHPRIAVGQRGAGLMRALLVRRRRDVIARAWRMGLKLLGCGWEKEVSPIRLLMLADTLGREVHELVGLLDAVLTDVGASP